MAITVENSNLVWQKAKVALAGASPFAQDVFKALKNRLATVGLNKDLQFVAISDLGADAVVADAACRVYGLYLKKGATATGAFVKAADHASSAGTTASDLVIELNEASKETFIINPTGWAQGTGFTIGSDTTADGSTASTAGDGPSGFAIIGAP
jgi:hypothetical protein